MAEEPTTIEQGTDRNLEQALDNIQNYEGVTGDAEANDYAETFDRFYTPNMPPADRREWLDQFRRIMNNNQNTFGMADIFANTPLEALQGDAEPTQELIDDLHDMLREFMDQYRIQEMQAAGQYVPDQAAIPQQRVEAAQETQVPMDIADVEGLLRDYLIDVHDEDLIELVREIQGWTGTEDLNNEYNFFASLNLDGHEDLRIAGFDPNNDGGPRYNAFDRGEMNALANIILTYAETRLGPDMPLTEAEQRARLEAEVVAEQRISEAEQDRAEAERQRDVEARYADDLEVQLADMQQQLNEANDHVAFLERDRADLTGYFTGMIDRFINEDRDRRAQFDDMVRLMREERAQNQRMQEQANRLLENLAQTMATMAAQPQMVQQPPVQPRVVEQPQANPEQAPTNPETPPENAETPPEAVETTDDTDTPEGETPPETPPEAAPQMTQAEQDLRREVEGMTLQQLYALRDQARTNLAQAENRQNTRRGGLFRRAESTQGEMDALHRYRTIPIRQGELRGLNDADTQELDRIRGEIADRETNLTGEANERGNRLQEVDQQIATLVAVRERDQEAEDMVMEFHAVDEDYNLQIQDLRDQYTPLFQANDPRAGVVWDNILDLEGQQTDLRNRNREAEEYLRQREAEGRNADAEAAELERLQREQEEIRAEMDAAGDPEDLVALRQRQQTLEDQIAARNQELTDLAAEHNDILTNYPFVNENQGGIRGWFRRRRRNRVAEDARRIRNDAGEYEYQSAATGLANAQAAYDRVKLMVIYKQQEHAANGTPAMFQVQRQRGRLARFFGIGGAEEYTINQTLTITPETMQIDNLINEYDKLNEARRLARGDRARGIKRAWDRWNRMPKGQRLAISLTLGTIGSAATLGFGTAIVMAGYRLGSYTAANLIAEGVVPGRSRRLSEQARANTESVNLLDRVNVQQVLQQAEQDYARDMEQSARVGQRESMTRGAIKLLLTGSASYFADDALEFAGLANKLTRAADLPAPQDVVPPPSGPMPIPGFTTIAETVDAGDGVTHKLMDIGANIKAQNLDLSNAPEWMQKLAAAKDANEMRDVAVEIATDLDAWRPDEVDDSLNVGKDWKFEVNEMGELRIIDEKGTLVGGIDELNQIDDVSEGDFIDTDKKVTADSAPTAPEIKPINMSATPDGELPSITMPSGDPGAATGSTIGIRNAADGPAMTGGVRLENALNEKDLKLLEKHKAFAAKFTDKFTPDYLVRAEDADDIKFRTEWKSVLQGTTMKEFILDGADPVKFADKYGEIPQAEELHKGLLKGIKKITGEDVFKTKGGVTKPFSKGVVAFNGLLDDIAKVHVDIPNSVDIEKITLTDAIEGIGKVAAEDKFGGKFKGASGAILSNFYRNN